MQKIRKERKKEYNDVDDQKYPRHMRSRQRSDFVANRKQQMSPKDRCPIAESDADFATHIILDRYLTLVTTFLSSRDLVKPL